MGKILWFPTLTALGLLATPAGLGAEGREGGDSSWASEFSVAKSDVAANGRNPYFVLEPGYQLVLEGSDERATITVKDEMRIIEGVDTRVVETSETQGNELIEICRNYFAVNQKTNDVLCFGQDVDIYLGGRVVAHDGAWRAGVDGARCGLEAARPTAVACQALPGSRPRCCHDPGRGRRARCHCGDTCRRVQELFAHRRNDASETGTSGPQVVRTWYWSWCDGTV